MNKLSGHLRIWADNTYFWPDIVRWLAVICSPEVPLTLLDFTQSNARQFYLSMGNLLWMKAFKQCVCFSHASQNSGTLFASFITWEAYANYETTHQCSLFLLLAKLYTKDGEKENLAPLPRTMLFHKPFGCRDGTEVRALASHQCGPGSIPRFGVICGLCLLVLFSAPRGFLLLLRVPHYSKTTIRLDFC